VQPHLSGTTIYQKKIIVMIKTTISYLMIMPLSALKNGLQISKKHSQNKKPAQRQASNE